MLRTAILDGNILNHDKDFFGALDGLFFGGILDGFNLDQENKILSAGRALVSVQRNQGDKIMVFIENTNNYQLSDDVDLSGNTLLYIQIPQDAIDDGSQLAEDGTGVAIVASAGILPNNSCILYSISDGDAIKNIVKRKGTANTIRMTDKTGTEIEILMVNGNGKLLCIVPDGEGYKIDFRVLDIIQTDPTDESSETEVVSAIELYNILGGIRTEILETDSKTIFGAINELFNNEVGFFKYQQIDPATGNLVKPNTTSINAFSIQAIVDDLDDPTTQGQIGLVINNNTSIKVYKANSSLSWILLNGNVPVLDGYLFSEDIDNTPKYFIGGIWKEFGGGEVDLSNYWDKQHTIASYNETITIGSGSYLLKKIGNMIECDEDTYQALYDGGVLDNEPYASMYFFIPEEE